MKRKKTKLDSSADKPLNTKECEAVLFCLKEKDSSPPKKFKVSDAVIEYQLNEVKQKLTDNND